MLRQILLLLSSSALFYSSTSLPSNLIIGYPSWSECDQKVIKAANDGVNVIIWFAINLLTDEKTGLPVISGGPNYSCVAETASYLNKHGLSSVHLISIGGWDSPHPDTRNNASAYYSAWKKWNAGNSRPELGFHGFEGFDWDLEGNDNTSSPNNFFTLEVLDLVGEMSQMAKKDGFIVTMAPAESYLDVTTSQFDRSLLHNYPEWEVLQPNFNYHGHNCYAYLLAKYGRTKLPRDNTEVFTWDFVSVQFYEGYSHIEYNTSILNQTADDYLIKIIPQYIEGWVVDFSSDPDTGLPEMTVRIPKEHLVIGLANGWAGDGKFILIPPRQLEKAYKALKRRDYEVRGFMFWDIADEGKIPIDWEEELWLASDLNKFMNTRK